MVALYIKNMAGSKEILIIIMDTTGSAYVKLFWERAL